MRIILADHQAQSRLTIKMQLAGKPEFDLVSEAVDAREVLTLADKLRVDLILIDHDLPGKSLEKIIQQLRALEPAPFIVVISSDLNPCRSTLKAGADAFISKGSSLDWLLRTLDEYAQHIQPNHQAPLPSDS